MLEKLIRNAVKFAKRADDEKLTPQERAKFREKANLFEQELAIRIFNRHAVSNAEIDVKRANKLLARRTTGPRNLVKRQEALRAAELKLSEAMVESSTIEKRAREFLDELMGRIAKK
jgi:uncharacterized membrane protein YqiK